MQSLVEILTWYPLFGLPAGIGFAAVWVVAGIHHIDLQIGDRLLLVLPWLVLCAVSVAMPFGKTLANLAEIVLLAVSVPLVLILRVMLGRQRDQARLAMRLAWAVSGFGAAMWVLMPNLGTTAA